MYPVRSNQRTRVELTGRNMQCALKQRRENLYPGRICREDPRGTRHFQFRKLKSCFAGNKRQVFDLQLKTYASLLAAQITQAWLKAFEACIELMDAGSEPACRHAADSKALVDVLLYLEKNFSVPNMLLGIGIERQPDVAVKRLHESDPRQHRRTFALPASSASIAYRRTGPPPSSSADRFRKLQTRH